METHVAGLKLWLRNDGNNSNSPLEKVTSTVLFRNRVPKSHGLAERPSSRGGGRSWTDTSDVSAIRTGQARLQ